MQTEQGDTKKNNKLKISSSIATESHDYQHLSTKDNSITRPIFESSYHRFSSVKSRKCGVKLKPQKAIPSIVQFNKILNFSIENELKNLAENLESNELSKRYEYNDLKRKPKVRLNSRFNKKIRKMLKVSFELPQL